MTRTESHLRHAAAARRKRSALRRLTIEQLEGRHAPGSLIPIPFANLFDPAINLASLNYQTLNTRPVERRNRDSSSFLPPLHGSREWHAPSPDYQAPSYSSHTPQKVAAPNQARSYDGLQRLEQLNAPKLVPSLPNIRTGEWTPQLATGGGGGGGSGAIGSSEPRSRDGSSSAEPARTSSSAPNGGGDRSDGIGSGGGGGRSIEVADVDSVSHVSIPSVTTSADREVGNAPSRIEPPSQKDGLNDPASPGQPTRSEPGGTLVLNHVPHDQWRFREYGGSGQGSGRLEDPLWMVEGNSFIAQLELDWTLPTDIDRIQFQFRVHWDGDSDFIRDAFEATWLDDTDKPLLPTIASGRDSFFNATEGLNPQAGIGTSFVWEPLGTTWIGTVTADVTGVPAGTEGTFLFRLINNDNQNGDDNRSYARLDLTNTAPIANEDAYTLLEDSFLQVAAPGALANDKDRDDDPLQMVLVTPPSHGTLTWNADGSFQYTPFLNFAGTDRFEYRATDGTAQSDIATVALHVTAVNDPPIALDDHYSLHAGKSLTRDAETGVLANDYDLEDDPLTAILVIGAGMGPNHGQVVLQSDGSFVYTADPGWTGDDYFTYQVNGAGMTSEIARAHVRSVPGIANVVVDSTRWRAAFPFAEAGFPITTNTRNLPWFHINQVRIEFTEPIQTVQSIDVVWQGSSTLGVDYQSSLLLSQSSPKVIELTLGNQMTIGTDRILIGLLETIRDADGNALDGDGDGRGGDPASIRFQVVPGDADGSGLVLSNDVTLVRNSQLGLGAYDPFHDVNGTGLILSDDVTLTRNNQLGLANSDRALFTLAAPSALIGTSKSSKFFVSDTTRQTFRYRPDGSRLRAMDLPAADEATGIAMTVDGDRIWTVTADHRVAVYDAASGLSFGSWAAGHGTQAEGIAVHGDDVWIVDSAADQIAWYSRAVDRTSGSMVADRVFPLASANNHPTGIATDGATIWVSDSEADRVFVYSRLGESLGSWSLDVQNRDPVGITLDPRGGTDLWVVDRAERRVFTYRGGLDWRSASEPASSSFPLSDQHGEPTDIADPPPAERLSDFPIAPVYGTTSFAEESDVLHVEFSLEHRGTHTLRDPFWLGVRNLSRADVTWLNHDGSVDSQIPYMDLRPYLSGAEWKPGDSTKSLSLRFHNPTRAPFDYELVLFPSVNEPPQIVSEPRTVTRPDGAIYRYDVEAIDPNQDIPLTYHLISHPQGMSIDERTGQITWTTGPGSESVGVHRIEVQVSDPEGLKDIQAFNLEVLPLEFGNRPPQWLTAPIVSAYVKTDYKYASQGFDIDGDRLQYAIVDGPLGMSIDAEQGIVTWTPTDEQLGSHSVTLRVFDNASPSLWSDQTFVIVVLKQPGNHDPVIVSHPSPIHNAVTPNQALGPVTPTAPIVIQLHQGASSTHSITYTRAPSLPQADVLFLLDDTLSMDNWGTASRPGSIALTDTFMRAIEQLDAAYPTTDFAFGVSRLENFALSDPNGSLNRPFILNQPMLRREDAGFERFLQQALLRRAPGGGAGTISIYEALYQAATGIGLDYGSHNPTGSVGDPNNTNLDNGHSLDIEGQTTPNSSGDVAAFNTPRSFSYRVISPDDYPLLALDASTEAVMSGELSLPRSATMWRFLAEQSEMELLLETPEDIADAEWMLMNPSGATIFRGEANIDVSIPLAVPGEYTLVLNSLSDQKVDFSTKLKLRSNTMPLEFDRDMAGQLRFHQQVDRYAFRVEKWSTLYLDLMTASPEVQYRIMAPDGAMQTGDLFQRSNSDGSNSKMSDQLLKLAPGDYQIEVSLSHPSSYTSPKDYRLAVRALESATTIGSLSAKGLLEWLHQGQPLKSALYRLTNASHDHLVEISVPNPSTHPGVRQWVLDEQGNVLHYASSAPGEIRSDASDPFVLIRPAGIYVLVDTVAFGQSTAERLIQLRSHGPASTQPSHPINAGQWVHGSVRPQQAATYHFEVPSIGDGNSYYFDPTTLVANVAWSLQGPSGAWLARSRLDGEPLQDDRLERLSNRAFHLSPGTHRLVLTHVGNPGPPGPGTEFRFRVIDLASVPKMTRGDILVDAADADGSKLVRIDRENAESMWFFSGGAAIASRWQLQAPNHESRFDLPGTVDGGLQATRWNGPGNEDFWIDFGRVDPQPGALLARVIPRRVIEQTLDSSQMGEGSYITSRFEDRGVEHEYRFTLSNPSRFYFEPRPNVRRADADWSLVGPGGKVVEQRLFSESGSSIDSESNNVVWLREGEYRLTVRSRAGDVDFRWVDLAKAGQFVDSTVIDGAAGPNPEGTRFFTFNGRHGDWNMIRFTEPTNGGSSGLLRIRAVDAYARNLWTRIVPWPINGIPSRGYVDIDLELPATGIVTLLIEDPVDGNLRRPFSLQRQYRSSFPDSQVSTLTPSTAHGVDVDSSRLLYDAELASAPDKRWFIDGLQATGEYPTQITVDQTIGGRWLDSTMFESDLFQFSNQENLILQTYTRSVPTTPGELRGGAGFRASSVPIIVLATDTWSDVRPVELRGATQPTEILGYGDSIVPQDHLTGAFLNPEANPGSAYSFLFPDNNGISGSLRYRDLSVGGPPSTRIVRDQDIRTTEATVQQTIDALLDLGAYVLPVMMDHTRSYDPPEEMQRRKSWYDLPQALARLTGAFNASDSTLMTGDEQYPIAPNQPLTFFIDGYNSTRQATQLTDAVSQFLQFGRLDIEVVSSDPSIEVRTSGPIDNLGPGQTAMMEVEIVGDGTPRTFDLLIVRKGTGNIVGSIPVQIVQPYRYDTDAIDADDDPLQYSLIGESFGATIDPALGEIAWSPPAPGEFTFTVEVSDGRGGRDQQSWSVRVGPDLQIQNNQPPRLEAIPDQTAWIGQDFTLQVIASDPDSDPLFYFLRSANPRSSIPDGMSIDRRTGEIAWRPRSATSGWTTVLVGARDALGGMTTTPMRIRSVLPPIDNNSPPVIDPIPDLAVFAGQSVSYRLKAFDPQNDPIQFRLSLGAERGAVIDPQTDTFHWKPTSAHLGVQEMIVAASDRHGAVTTRKFRVIVHAPNQAPVFLDQPIPGPAQIDRPYEVRVRAIDPDDDTIAYRPGLGNPEGLVVNAETGIVKWRPRLDQAGLHRIAIEADDGRGGVAALAWELHVSSQPGPNRLPIFLTEPRTEIRSGFLWSYRFDTYDEDGDPIEYFVRGPDHVSYDEAIRHLSWNEPMNGVSELIEIEAFDGYASSVQSFRLTVTPLERNEPPSFTSFPTSLVANAVRPWRYDANATDPERDAISYAFVQQPPIGMRMDALTGWIHWTPGLDQIGEHTVTLSATDVYGASGYQNFTLRVTASDLPPTIDSIPPVTASANVEYHYPILATDPEVQPLRFSMLEGPTSSSIDASGILRWLPIESSADAVLFEIAVDTGVGTSVATQRWFVTVESESSSPPPRIESTPSTVAGVDQNYLYQVVASVPGDPDAELRYELIQSPRMDGVSHATPMTIDPHTGRVEWKPVFGHLNPGAEWVEIAVTHQEHVARQRFRIRVTTSNREPEVAPWSNPQTLVGQVAALNLRVDDPEGDSIRYVLLDGPAGMFIDVHGRIRWATSMTTLPGRYPFSVLATDDRGLEEQPLHGWFDIVADIEPPNVFVSSDRNPTRTTRDTMLFVDAVDVSGIALRSLSIRRLIDGHPTGDPLTVPLNASGLGEYRFDSAGTYRLLARAQDVFGNEGVAETDLIVGDGSAAPRLVIESPIADASMSEPTPVIGSIEDSDLASWTLRVVSRDGTPLRTLAQGTTKRPQGSTLGWIDTTLLPSESMRLILEAIDLSGQVSTEEIAIHVTGMLKLGNVRLTFTDATIPVAGIPVTVRRTYDSLQASKLGDFGYGWKLEFQQMQLAIPSETLGEDGSTRYPPFIDGSRVLVTLPNGTQEGFTFEPRVRARVPVSGAPLTWIPYFKPDEGNTSNLGVPQTELNRQGGGNIYRVGSLANNDSYSPMDPAIAGYFVLQTADGLKHFIDAATGNTTRIADRNGNEIRWTDEGLVSNRGRSLLIERNHRGLISKIIDPRGNALTYAYDSIDRLVSFQDRNQTEIERQGGEATRTQFRYRDEPQYRNYLDHAVDATGTIAMTVLYDLDTGRVAGMQDAVGNTARQTYTMEPPSGEGSHGRYAVHSYAPGHSPDDPNAPRSSIELNGRGLPISSSLPSGEKIAMEYNSPLPAPSETRVIIGLDDRTSGESDDLVTKTNFGWSSTFSYAFVSQTVDPRGNVTEKTFDRSGQLIAETDSSGNTTRFLYDRRAELDSQYGLPVRGNVKAIFDADGNVSYTDSDPITGLPVRVRTQQAGSGRLLDTYLSYNAQGDLIRVVDPQGETRLLAHDSNGNGRGTDYIWKDPRGLLSSQELTTSTLYDANDKAIGKESRIDGVIQSSSSMQFDGMGRLTRTIDANDLRTETLYDKRGLVIQSRTETINTAINPSSNREERLWRLSRTLYDEQGRVVLTASGMTQYASDIERIIPDPSDVSGTRVLYNQQGQIVSREELRNVDIEIVRDGIGGAYRARLRAGSSPIVISKTTITYDSQNRVTQSTDGYGRITETYFDRWGNVVESRTQTKDVSGETLWLVTRSVYDAKGREVATTDPYTVSSSTPLGKPGGVSPPVFASFSLFDARGRSIGSERRENVILGWKEDHQVVSAIIDKGVLVSRTGIEYDRQGRPFKQIAADGQESVTLYDELGRSIATLGMAVEPASVGLHGSVYDGKRVRQRTETRYNSLGQAYQTITGVIHIENLDGSVFAVDESSSRVTEQVFDAKGQIIETIYPDGSSTRMEYDSFGRVTAEIDQLGNRKDMSYNSHGQLVQVQLPPVPDPLNANLLTRPTFSYEYNEQGQMTKLIDANGNATLFGFNATNQSVSRTLPLGHQESFSYDLRGRQNLHVTFEGVHIRTLFDDSPTGEGRPKEQQFFENAEAYNSGSGTPTERRTYVYDAFGRLVEVSHIRPGVIDRFTTTYDRQGRVTRETTPVGFTQYEYDALDRKIKATSGTEEPTVLSEVHYSYDGLGKLATVETVTRDGKAVDGNDSHHGAPPESTRYHYDLLGRLDYIELPNSVVEDYLFDEMDRLDAMWHFRSDSDNSDLSDNFLRASFDYSYRMDGKRIELIESFGGNGVGYDSGDGVLVNHFRWSYDHAGRLMSETLDSSDDSMDQLEAYAYDLFANRVRRTVDKPATEYVDQVFSYLYNANDQVLSEEIDDGSNGVGNDHATTYRWTGTQNTERVVSEGALVRSTQAMSYGLSGQLERIVSTKTNSAGQLIDRTQVEYRYDPQGTRFISIETTDTNLETSVIDGLPISRVEYLIEKSNFTGYQQSIIETTKNGAGEATKRVSYIFGLDEISQTTTLPLPNGEVGWGEGETLSFGHDGRGSVKVLFEATAMMAQIFAYSAYGELIALHDAHGFRIPDGIPLTSLLYNGESYDIQAGMYNMRARWYRPSLARWDRLDPFAGNPTDPFSYNKYGFVHSEPILNIDPSGKYLIAIDGTGTEDWLTNPKNPQKLSNGRWLSHVANFHDDYGGQGADRKYYDFGPRNGKTASDLTAIESKALMELDAFRNQNAANKSEPIDIIGWSRGAYSALRIAARLADRNIKVRFLGLYDPVDMTYFDNYAGLSLDPYRVTWNVENTFVAVGVNGRFNYRDYDDDSPIWFNWPRIRVLEPFRTGESVTKSFHISEYEATHGAIGGTPGYSPDPSIQSHYDYDHDVRRSISADSDMRAAAISAGVPITRLAANDYGFPPSQQGLPGQDAMPQTRTWYNFIWRSIRWAFQGAGV